ncbi:MAG: FecR domain-containing protein [bacterium]
MTDVNTMPPGRIVTVLFLSLLGLSPLTAPAYGKPLEKALVKKTVNQVLVHENIGRETDSPRQARAGRDILQGSMALETRRKSRSELLFADGSVARIGSNSLFSFTETARELQLGRGILLLQVPGNSERTTVRTAAASAALTGTTVMLEQQPDQYVKMIVLEGTLQAYIPGRIGESLPEPVYVNLEKLVETSGLIQELEQQGNIDVAEFEDRSLDQEQYQSSLEEQKKQIEVGDL